MKIAVMGSGGVGGFYGGHLAYAGCDVSFIARGSHLAAMREHGLTIEIAPHTISLIFSLSARRRQVLAVP